MVRILTCHHFEAQRTAKTEEPVGVAVVDDSVLVVGLEHRINVYYLSDIAGSAKEFDISIWLGKRRRSDFGHGEFGGFYSFARTQKDKEAPVDRAKVGQTGELRLSHYFAPVAVLRYLEYNSRGHFLACLEKQEALTSIRVYFKWDKKFKGGEITARIAGLVSPTANRENEENSLLLIELPLPALFLPKAIATCELSGNIAVLSTDQRISIYSYKIKEGRLKTHYGDFDLSCTVQLFGIIPEKISIVSNYIACLELTKAYVFKILLAESKLPQGRPASVISENSVLAKFNGFPAGKVISTSDISQNKNGCGKVVFDRKNDSVKVFLNTITRANRKKKQPNSFISEEYQEEINLNRTGVIFSTTNVKDGFIVEDLLRVHVNNTLESTENLLKMGLYPIRIKDQLGGISFVVATCKEAFLYHIPTKPNSFVVRESIYSFTSTMTSFVFDNVFLHVLTSTGVETFTSRHLYNALKDAEEFETFVNDCPLHEESSVLIGMNPFINARTIAGNEHCLCVLTSPATALASLNPSPALDSKRTTEQAKDTNEDNSWTIYFLRCPNWETLQQDITREANIHKVSNPDAYFALTCELYLILRTAITSHPYLERDLNDKLLKTSRLIGFEYFKKSTRAGADEVIVNDLLDKGITYLILGACDVPYFFTPGVGKADVLKDPQLIAGIVKFIDTSLPRTIDDSLNSVFSPALARQILEFLVVNSKKTLVELVVNVPWFRECNGKRLLEILNAVLTTGQYTEEECLATILTIININGSYSKGRRQVKEVLDKMAEKQLKLKLHFSSLVERKKAQLCLTDLLICLSAANSGVHNELLSEALRQDEVGILDLLLAFSHGVNLNADPDVQKCLTKDLQILLENYFVDKMNDKSWLEVSSPTLSRDDEIRALHALARSYLTHITIESNELKPGNIAPVATSIREGEDNGYNSYKAARVASIGSVATTKVSVNEAWLRFGKIPEFLSCIVPDLMSPNQPDNSAVSQESREYFMKLASLLGSVLGRTPGLEELISNALGQKGHLESPVSVAIRLLSESPEKAITTLISGYPTILVLYAKEMFGKSTRKWKLLVTKLKEKIKNQPEDIDILSTIIESVYLHLANTLSPLELEHVLDKKEENAKFHAACARIDLANSINAKVIAMAEEYLNEVK